jgi:hypothetical protein
VRGCKRQRRLRSESRPDEFGREVTTESVFRLSFNKLEAGGPKVEFVVAVLTDIVLGKPQEH